MQLSAMFFLWLQHISFDLLCLSNARLTRLVPMLPNLHPTPTPHRNPLHQGMSNPPAAIHHPHLCHNRLEDHTSPSRSISSPNSWTASRMWMRSPPHSANLASSHRLLSLLWWWHAVGRPCENFQSSRDPNLLHLNSCRSPYHVRGLLHQNMLTISIFVVA